MGPVTPENFHSCGRTSGIELLSSLWVAQLTGVVIDFISVVAHLPSHCGFYFVFGCLFW